MLFGAVSAALIALIYFTPSPEPGFAGANFGYNISFFFPVFLASFVCWAVGVASYIAFMRSSRQRSALRIASPPVLLLPFTLQAAWIVRLLLMLRQTV